ncbi:MAG TPA: mannose-6-phosphate isomerase, class I [Ilumatobacteraceae bacterium]|nr:mannose-6-phosphate isomerase, class I [Ilumatobacteraceae bacterium]
MRRIEGVVQHYAWGDHHFLPRLLDEDADGTPWAEWWLGTHPGGPAQIVKDGPLRDTSGDLPYLLKILTAGQALSLQTHPDAATAAEGFARENAAGIALDAPTRVYRDAHAKPELVCALTQFDALCGFRPLAATDLLLRSIGARDLADHLREHGLQATVGALYRGQFDTAATIAACAAPDTPECRLVRDLAAQYPGDPSVVVTLLLNRVLLQPGEALFLGPGNLHAYLHGAGVEVMGASDNVVRGGLTPKHVDVDELLRVLSYEPLADPIVRPVHVDEYRVRYPTPGAPFELWCFEVDGPLEHTATGRELFVCTEGDASPLSRGQAAYLAPGEDVTFDGFCTVYRVAENRAVRA